MSRQTSDQGSKIAAPNVTKTMGGESSKDEPTRKLSSSNTIFRAGIPFIVGGVSGMVATCCIQPIDMVKVRLQLYGEGTRGGPKPTPFGLARTIVREGSILDLYSGLSAGLLRQAVYSTARLGFFDTFLGMFQASAESKGRSVGFAERAGAGLAAGAVAATIGNPTEVALIRMQSDGLEPKADRANYRSVFDTLIRITRNEGVLSLWNGCYPTVIRAMSTNFGQLAFFSESKNQLSKHTKLSARNKSVIASAVAGFFAAFFSLPFDFMKTRLQRQTRAPDGSLPYKGMFDCFLKVTREEGLLRFYRGFGTYFFRIAPHSIIALIVYDQLNTLVH